MPSTKFLLHLLLLLTPLPPTLATPHIQTTTSPSTNLNPTALLTCLSHLNSTLQTQPRSSAMQHYTCGNATFYYGTPGFKGAMGQSNLSVWRKCEQELVEKAEEGRDWMECRVRGAWGERRVGWKLEGIEGEGRGAQQNDEDEEEGVDGA
ncbi:hypothetical protein CERZMDRAFT_103350 [Cercospora zeae-maydis SCOH1-5]|uniref:Uncharacterized protein n=1 Tax=Cercospora zeae-maydis SCOH1-5 TaxID=717836 RepID=A0A6A6EZB2_9PEZI|nr:hypothetical protein CERZMDRAFT_103350 [Cercospora zeae-maydis SCOH1-5]